MTKSAQQMSPSSWQHGKIIIDWTVNVNWLHECYSMIDGLLLRPSRPALSLDSTFVQRAFGSGGPNGHLVAAFTQVGT